MFRLHFLEGDPTRCSTKLQDNIPLLQQLWKLHQEELVHSDLHEVNIVYTEQGAQLIDYDYTDKEDVQYPDSYAFYANERHLEARPWSLRKKIHDHFALLLIMKNKVEVSFEVKEKLKSIEMRYVIYWRLCLMIVYYN